MTRSEIKLVFCCRANISRGLACLLFFLFPISAYSAAVETECSNYFDNRRITLVVPFAAGGGYDSYARLFAPVFESHTGARVRVRNLTGANGMIGIKAVADARPENLTLGIFDPLPLMGPQLLGPDGPDISSFAMLGSFIMDTAIVVSRRQDDLLSNEVDLKVIGVEASIVRALLVAKSLNWNISLVRGYLGTADRWLALLRGDIDMVFGTTESLSRQLQGDPDTKAFLSLTDRPNEIFPDIPYLAGTGGTIDQKTQGLPEAERQQRMHLAQLAADLSTKVRTINVTSEVSPRVRSCLIDAVNSTLTSDEMQNAVLNQNLDFQSSTASEIQQLIDKHNDLFVQNKDLIDEIISEIPGAQ